MCKAIAVASLILAASAAPALADRIDGDWCDAKGNSISIDGPRIKTPGGANIIGQYARHEFLYTAPKEDADAGRQVYLRIFSDDDMASVHLKDAKADGEPVMWHRCKPVS